MVAAVKPPALMETLQLPQQAALVLLFQSLPPTSASLHPPVWILKSHQCWLFSRGPVLESVTDSEPAATAAMTPVQVSFIGHVISDDRSKAFESLISDLFMLLLFFNLMFYLYISLGLINQFQTYILLSLSRCSTMSPANCVSATTALTGHTFTRRN